MGRRISAERFGQWSRDLPLHLGPSARRTPALAFQQTPNSPSVTRPRSPGESSNRLLAPSVSQPGTRTPSPSYRLRPPVPVHADVLANSGSDATIGLDSDSESVDGVRSRTTSSKRRKRALRGKAQTGQSTPPSTVKSDAALYAASILAASSSAAPSNEQHVLELVKKPESVAREASLIMSPKSPPSVYTALPPSAPIVTMEVTVTQAIPPRVTPARSTPDLRTKKSTKWTDIFKRDSGSDQEVPTAAEWAVMDSEKEERMSLSSPTQMLDSSPVVSAGPPQPSATAKNVANLIMSLDSPAHVSRGSADDATSWNVASARSASLSSRGRRKDRRGSDRDNQRAVSPGSLVSVSTASTNASNVSGTTRGRSVPSKDHRTRSKSPAQIALDHFNLLNPKSAADLPPPVPAVPEPYRASVPVPVHLQLDSPPARASIGQQSGRRSYAPSIASISTTTTSSSAFTAFSGKNRWRGSNSSASVRSVSTAATSISSGSSGSWRATGNGGKPPPLPPNIKQMDGIPRILDELPRHRGFASDQKKRERQRAPSAPTSPTPSSSFGLGTIAEKPKKSSMKPPRSPIGPTFNRSRFNNGPSVDKADANELEIYQAGALDAISSFDSSGMSFGAARGGLPGLHIDTDAANTVAGYTSGMQMQVPGGEGQGASVAPVGAGTVKPPKTPTKSRLWNWRK